MLILKQIGLHVWTEDDDDDGGGGGDDEYDDDDDCFDTALFSALEQTHCARMWQGWLAFYSAILNIHRSGVLAALAWLVVLSLSIFTKQFNFSSSVNTTVIPRLNIYPVWTWTVRVSSSGRCKLSVSGPNEALKAYIEMTVVGAEVLLYVHRNRRLIRDGSPGRPPLLSHSSWVLTLEMRCSTSFLTYY